MTSLSNAPYGAFDHSESYGVFTKVFYMNFGLHQHDYQEVDVIAIYNDQNRGWFAIAYWYNCTDTILRVVGRGGGVCG